MAVLLTPPYLQFFDSDGVTPLNGGKVYTYTSTGGTFATPKATYTTAAGDVAAPNPIILNARGIPETGNGGVWLSGTYDFKVTDSSDVQVGSQLAVTAFTALAASSTAYFESFSGTGSQTAFTTSTDLGTDEKAIYVWVNDGLEENVTNGSFATDTGWTKGTGWTIGSGVATATGAISTALSQTAAITLVASQAYVLTYTVTRSAGDIIPSIGGTNGVTRSASGTYTEVISCGTTQTLAFTGAGFTGTLDNISITVANSEGFNIQNPSAYTINGTTLTFATAPASGTNNIYVSAPSTLVGAASSAAADAAASAAAALASENQAGVYAGQLTIVSTTSLAIGTGSKVFTVVSGLSLNAGQFILIVSDASPTVNYMWGTIASYSGTTLTVTVAAIGGSGTLADWTMYLTGERGTTGATGSISDLSGVPNSTPVAADELIFIDVGSANATAKATIQQIIDAATSGWKFLQTQVASASATLDFAGNISSTYETYALVISGLVPGSDGGTINLVVGTGATPTYQTGASDYSMYGQSYDDAGNAIDQYFDSADPAIEIARATGSASNESVSMTIFFYQPANASLYTLFRWDGVQIRSTGAIRSMDGHGAYKAATAVTAIRLSPASGTFPSGRATLFGIPHA